MVWEHHHDPVTDQAFRLAWPYAPAGDFTNLIQAPPGGTNLDLDPFSMHSSALYLAAVTKLVQAPI
jgi:hypothetical protein